MLEPDLISPKLTKDKAALQAELILLRSPSPPPAASFADAQLSPTASGTSHGAVNSHITSTTTAVSEAEADELKKLNESMQQIQNRLRQLEKKRSVCTAEAILGHESHIDLHCRLPGPNQKSRPSGPVKLAEAVRPNVSCLSSTMRTAPKYAPSP